MCGQCCIRFKRSPTKLLEVLQQQQEQGAESGSAMALGLKLAASSAASVASLGGQHSAASWELLCRQGPCAQGCSLAYRNGRSWLVTSGILGGLRRGRRGTIVMQASEKNKTQSVEEEVSDNRILSYCSIDKKKDKRSLGELEQDFLTALQSFYYDKKPIMTNEEFDILKEELLWEGSSVVILSPDEQRFMEASLAFAAGKPFLTDKEYDELKRKLKKASSKVAIEGPRCSLRSKKVYSDSTVDYLKMTLLNVPAAVVSLLVVFFLDDLTGFEITYLLELPEPYGFIFTWSVVLPATFYLARFITNQIFKDALILKGPCPNCGAENNSYFGTILTVKSGGTANDVKCEQCKALLQFNSDTRLITLEQTPGPKDSQPKSSPA